MSFFFNDTATTEIYTLSLHDALPIYTAAQFDGKIRDTACIIQYIRRRQGSSWTSAKADFALVQLEPCLRRMRSEEHTPELQSPDHLVSRLLLQKKNTHQPPHPHLLSH